jgi:hypothetical protein
VKTVLPASGAKDQRGYPWFLARAHATIRVEVAQCAAYSERVASNQKNSEKTWRKYGSVLAMWQSANHFLSR